MTVLVTGASGHIGGNLVRELLARGRRVRVLVRDDVREPATLAPGGVFGPLDFKPSRMGRLFLDLAARKRPANIGGGFDFVDVRDLVRTALVAEEKGRTGENYLVAHRWVSVPDLARIAAAETSVPAPSIISPMWAARLGAPFMDAFGHLTGREPLYTRESLHALRASEISSEKARAELGHVTRPVEETVRDIHRSFRDLGLLPVKP